MQTGVPLIVVQVSPKRHAVVSVGVQGTRQYGVGLETHNNPLSHAFKLVAVCPQGSPTCATSLSHEHNPVPLPVSKHPVQLPGAKGLQSEWQRPPLQVSPF